MSQSKQPHEAISDQERNMPRNRPGWYDVIILDDEDTRSSFVRRILVAVFGYTPLDAVLTTTTIEACGLARVGTYRYSEARAKVRTALRLAAEQEFPLRLTLCSSRRAPENA